MITLAKINGAEGKQWVGQSTDDKTTVNAESGVNDLFFELDTGIFYYFDGTEWQVIPSGSGGGGTPTVTMTSDWGATTASAVVGEGTPVTATELTGGKWVENNGDNEWVLFADGVLPVDWIRESGYSYVAGAWNDADHKYITGASLYVPANETYSIPSAILCLSKANMTEFTFSAYDAENSVYAEVVFSLSGDGTKLTFVSAAMGTAPGATQDITALFPALGAKILFFCQAVE